MRRWVVGTVLAAVVVLAGCTGDDAGPSTAAALPAHPTDTDLAAAVDCGVWRDFGDDPVGVAPLRSGVATDGVECFRGETELHLFVRASSGSFERIDRAVATNVARDGAGDCTSWVAVGETWFALADDEDVLAEVADTLGGTVREILPTGPPASYIPPGC